MDKSGSNTKPDAESINGSAIVVGATPPAQLVTQPPTYRQIIEEDLIKKPPRINQLECTINMGKANGGTDATDVDDGAKERMLKDDVKLTIVPPKKDDSEVKFMPENGDAKIDIGSVKQSLSGLGKAELMKYANDPFWIRLRWLLFIVFWALWAAMLFGAIAIIVMAPKKCTNVWKESIIVKMDALDPMVKDLHSMESYLAALKDRKVRAVLLSSILKGTLDGSTEDYTNVDPKVGLLTDFRKFTKSAHEKGISVILEVNPNHSSDKHIWFTNSIKKVEPYTSYYMWADKKPNGDPPNNWKSLSNRSGWTMHNQRNQFYFHQFNESQPDLNYTNPAVIDEFSDILKFWMGQGVKGFILSNTLYLVEDPNLADDLKDLDTPDDSYESLLHDKTKDTTQSHEVLQKWRDIVKQFTSQEGLFASSDEISPATVQAKVLDLPQVIKSLSEVDSSVTAKELKDLLSDVNTSWSSINLNYKNDLRTNMPKVADSLILLTMLLPATPILSTKDVISSQLSYSNLSDARKSVAFLEGKTEFYLLNGVNEQCTECILTYTRVKDDSAAYLVMYNSYSKNTTVDLSSIPNMPKEVTVVTHSPNYAVPKSEKPGILMSNQIPMAAKSTIVVTYVPNKTS